MKFLKHIRSRSRMKSRRSSPEAVIYSQHGRASPNLPSAGRVQGLPVKVLARIFAYVCPHTEDESYTTCEESMIDADCTLCDLRDLAHCSETCRAWAGPAQSAL